MTRAVRLEEKRGVYCKVTKRLIPPETIDNMFVVGEVYKTVEGQDVRIIAESRDYKNYYGCVKGDDGIWRYDRRNDRGRVTGRTNYCPMNLVPPREERPWPVKSD